MKNPMTKSIVFSSAVFLAAPFLVHASGMQMDIGSSAYDLQDTFYVDVYLATDGSSINAVEASVRFDQENLAIVDIRDADSIVNFWIEKSTGPGLISFSGIIPGGFHGSRGKVVSLLFETIASGEASIALEGASAFANDGAGTREPISSQEKLINISKKISPNTDADIYSSDKYPPETFRPEVSRSDSVFDNQWFLSFSTTDKDSGISHYLIKEARFRALMFFKRWAVVDSPYVLHNQSRTSFIAIKAVDKAGNQTTERVYPKNKKPLLEKVAVGLGFCAVVILMLFLLKKLVARMKDNLEEL